MFVYCDSVLVYLREVGCDFVSCSLKAKIWLPQDVAQDVSKGYKFPSWCWLNGSDPE
jgi:hypothetical protein